MSTLVRSVIKADPDWFVVSLIEADGFYPASLNYEPIIAWDIHVEQDQLYNSTKYYTTRYAMPICLNSYVEGKICIKSPDGVFRFVEDCELLLESEVLSKLLGKDPPKATTAQGQPQEK